MCVLSSYARLSRKAGLVPLHPAYMHLTEAHGNLLLTHETEGDYPLFAQEEHITFSSGPPSTVDIPCPNPPPPSSKRESQVSTCLSKEPLLVDAADKEDGGLGEGHEEVADCEVDDEHVGGSPEPSAPVRGQKLSGGASAGELPSNTRAHTCMLAHRHELLAHRPIPLPSKYQPNSSGAWHCGLRSETLQGSNSCLSSSPSPVFLQSSPSGLAKGRGVDDGAHRPGTFTNLISHNHPSSHLPPHPISFCR